MQHWRYLAIILLITAGVFWGGLRNEFVQWDDDINIYRNQHIQRLNLAEIKWMFGDIQHALRYKPLSWLSWAILHSAFGLNARAYHVASLLFHCLNAVLLFFIISKLLALKFGDTVSAHRISLCATFGVLLWAVHPLRVEPVAWATGLPYCQSFFFLLISFLCYWRSAGEVGKMAPHTGFYWAAVLAYGISVLSYPIGLAYPLVLVIVDFLVLKRFPGGRLFASGTRRVWLEKLPFFGLAGILVGIALYGRLHASGIWAQPDGPSLNAFARLMQAFYIWAYYVWRPWFPFDLSPVYTTLFSFHPLGGPFIASSVLVVGITGLAVWKRRQWPFLFGLWLCHLVILIPVLGLTEHPHYPSDRYSYLSGIVLSLALAGLFLRLWKRERPGLITPVVAVVLVSILCVLSARQVPVWHDSVTLFHHMIAKLGDNPYRASMYWRLGQVYAEQGDVRRAEELWHQSTRIWPELPEPYLYLGQLRQAAGDLDGALAHYREALRASPHWATANARAADILMKRGKTEEAIGHYRAVLRVQPNNVEVLNNLAWLRATARESQFRDGIEAVALAEQACKLTNYKVPVLIGTLAAAYAEAGQFQEAVDTGQKAATLAREQRLMAVAALNEKLVELYRAGKPYREKAATSGQ